MMRVAQRDTSNSRCLTMPIDKEETNSQSLTLSSRAKSELRGLHYKRSNGRDITNVAVGRESHDFDSTYCRCAGSFDLVAYYSESFE